MGAAVAKGWYDELSVADQTQALATPAGLACIHTRPFPKGSGGRWELYNYFRLITQTFMPTLVGGGRQMLFMPPRHGKSLFTSVYTAAWFLGFHRTQNVILTSYSADIAKGFSGKARTVIEDLGHLFGVRLHPKQRNTAHWQIQYVDDSGEWRDGGNCYAAGVGGGLPGRGAGLIVMDDVVRGQKDVTPDLMQKAYEWWIGILSTREEPIDHERPEFGGAIILVMTRWADADIAGRLLEDEGRADEDGDWTVTSLPALAKEDDPLEREEGEALCPQRYPREKLEKRRDSSDEGGILFQALFQQEPLPDEGVVWKAHHLHRWESIGGLITFANERLSEQDLKLHFVTIDPNLKKDELNDPTGFLIWAIAPRGELLCLEDHTERMDGSDDLIPLMHATRERFPGIPFYVESKAHGTEIMRACRRVGLDTVELIADLDKVTRALGSQPAFAAGMVFIPQNAVELAKELLVFPGGKHDDRADCVAYGVQVWRDRIRKLMGDPRVDEDDDKRRQLDPDAYLDDETEDTVDSDKDDRGHWRD